MHCVTSSILNCAARASAAHGCCARLLRRADYPRQFGGDSCRAQHPVWRGDPPHFVCALEEAWQHAHSVTRRTRLCPTPLLPDMWCEYGRRTHSLGVPALLGDCGVCHTAYLCPVWPAAGGSPGGHRDHHAPLWDVSPDATHL